METQTIMNHVTPPDWDPRSDAVQRDQVAAYDRMRETCPVAYSDFLGWSLFRHADVTRVLHDPKTFSNAVSRHVSVPNGMDPPQHSIYRQLIDPYFSAQRMAAFEPTCRSIVADLFDGLRGRDTIEWISSFGDPFAVQVQCAFLTWPASMHGMLRSWMQANQAAIFAQDRQRLAHLAGEFTEAVRDLVHHQCEADTDACDNRPVAVELMRERVQDRPLHERELVSILRNWTAGEVGTISAAVGILAHYLAAHPDLQQQLRDEPAHLPYAIEEILRIEGPLVSNRRVTTEPVEFHGRRIEAGATLTIIWIAANRDVRVFDEPTEFRFDRDPSHNLLYGAGIHVCPGAPLVRLELRVVLEQLLVRTVRIEPIPNQPPTHATYPAGGYSAVPLKITWR